MTPVDTPDPANTREDAPLNPLQALLRTTSSFLVTLDLKLLFALIVAVAVVSAEIVAATVSYLLIGEVPAIIWVAAFVTPVIVGSAIMLVLTALIEHLRQEVRDRVLAEEALLGAKEQAELANRAKSEFLANVSHELRSPLNAVIGFAEIMRSEMFGPLGLPRYREYARDIEASGNHLLELINDILDLSKIEAGKLDLHEDLVHPGCAIHTCLRLVRARADEARVALRTEIGRDLPVLYADEVKFKQILLNLLSNAVKFTLRGGTVTVRADVDPAGRFVLAVADTGIGIAPADMDKAMAAFRQVDSAPSRRYQGTGLGLPLTRALVELHGGTFTLASEVDVGTVATVTLPADRTVAPDRLAAQA